MPLGEGDSVSIDGAISAAPHASASSTEAVTIPGMRLRAFDPNWLAVLMFLMIIPISQIAGYFFNVPDQFSPGAALGLAVVAYPAFLIALRLSVQRLYRLSLASLMLACIIALLLTVIRAQTSAHDTQSPGTLVPVFAGVLLAVAFLAMEAARKRFERLAFLPVSMLAALAAVAAAGSVIETFLALTAKLLPYVGDRVFYRLDMVLDLDGLIALARLDRSSPDFHLLLTLAYSAMPLAVAAAAWSEQIFCARRPAGLLLQILIASCIGYAMYFLLPAAGPAYFYGDAFPMAMPGIGVEGIWTTTAATGPRNCLPSLHATWSILILLSLQYSPRWHRHIGGLFVLLTLLATIGLGEHYAIDWLAAMPLVLLVRGLTCRVLPLPNGKRLLSIVTGMAFLAGWVVVLRWIPVTPDNGVMLAIFSFASLLFPLWLERVLARAEQGPRMPTVETKLLPFAAGNRTAP